jgi:PPP family 3-phenylpropionic acid transporter
VQGLSGAEIGLILGASQISRTLTGPAIGLLADSLNKPKQVALTLAVANLVTNLTLLGRHDLLSLSLLCSLSNSLFSAMMPLGESLAVTRLPEEAYGRVRMWGSVGFAAANVLGGQIISTHGAEWMMPISIAGSAVLAASCMQLPGRSSDPPADGVETSMTAPISTQRGAIHDYPAAPAQESALREAASLIGNVKYIVFLLAACLIQASHAAYYTFGAIMLQQAGYSGGMIGALWGVGVAAEVCTPITP